MLKSLFARFHKEDDGGVYIFAGLSIVVLVGFVGMAVDIGQWMTERRETQSAADSAAIAAALEAARGASWSDIEARAQAVATANGYTNDQATSGGKMTVKINNPPLMGSKAGDPAYYEAVVRTQLTGLFSRIVHQGATSISTRAAATTKLMPSCVYALDPSASGAITFAGTANVSMDCSFLANSTSSDAIKQSGSSCVAANGLGAVGGVTINDPDCVSVPNIQGSQPKVEDPFAYLQPPSPIGPFTSPWCMNTKMAPLNITAAGPTTVDPGCYMNGIMVNNSGADVTFNPGLYVVDGIGLQILGGTVNGSDLTFYFPPAGGGAAGTPVVTIAAGTHVTLTASHPDYPGILFYQDPNDANRTVNLVGGADMLLTGVMYFPKGNVTYAGNSTGGTDWTVLVSKTVNFTGGGDFKTAALPGTTPLSVSFGVLAE